MNESQLIEYLKKIFNAIAASGNTPRVIQIKVHSQLPILLHCYLTTANELLGVFLSVASHSITYRLQDNMYSDFTVSMKWENLKRDFEGKVNYAY